MRIVDMEPPELIVQLIATGNGVSILSRWAAKDWIDRREVIAIPIGDQGLTIRWFAVARKTSHPTDMLNALEGYFKNARIN